MNSDPSWDYHRSFLAVFEEGSLSGAARRLGLTQPTVARHLDALEAAIGADLFVRSPRGLVPTDVGLELRPYAETIGATAAAMLRAASGSAGEVRGTVRVSASEIIGVEHLPPILARLRERHPKLAIELAVSNDIDDLLRREADIAVRNVAPSQETLVARRLPPLTLGLHAHRDYLARRGEPQTQQDVRDHAVIGFDRDTPATRAILQRFPVLERAQFALRTDSDLAQLAAIRAGFGIGICQVAVARRDPNLVRVLADAVSIPLGMWVVAHEDLKTSARCQAVFDALAQDLSALAQSE
ncbi:MAG TPA: LysR family transcriptional regulator [Rhizomicrobium sp.]|jgi:DNA-binding transcriptional LysR family regulator